MTTTNTDISKHISSNSSRIYCILLKRIESAGSLWTKEAAKEHEMNKTNSAAGVKNSNEKYFAPKKMKTKTK